MYSTDVYADVLFLINLAMDALCLTVTARLMHRSPHNLRLLAASVIGGVYGIVALFVETSSIIAFGLDVAVCVLMCAICMGLCKLWLVSGLYLLTSMVMGGIMTGLYHWLNRLGADAFLPQGEESLSTLSFVILAALGSVFTFVWGRIFRSSERKRASGVLVSVIFRGRQVNLRGMIDSGNLLTDPISGTPVIVVKKEAVMSLFSAEMAEALLEDRLPSDLATTRTIWLACSVRATA